MTTATGQRATAGAPVGQAEPDPRLRLLGADVAPHRVPEILRALDDVRVLFRFGRDCCGGAAVAGAAAVAMCTRLFGGVSLETDVPLPANWWSVSSIGELCGRVAGLRPAAAIPPQQTIVVTVGADRVGAGEFGMGGGNWTAALDTAPVAILAREPDGDHALGVHAAACLLTGQLLTRALARFGYPGVAVAETYTLDLLSHCPGTPGPGHTQQWHRPPGAGIGFRGARRALVEVAIAGVGSVGTSTAALLATALAPGFPITAITPDVPRPVLHLVDTDQLDPGRNPFRYPALVGGESGRSASSQDARETGSVPQLGMPAKLGRSAGLDPDAVAQVG
jgi:hypothetical protein